MKLTAKKTFLLAYEKVKNVNTWTQYNYAKDRNGISVIPYDPNAVCWCSTGAIDAVIHGIDNTFTLRRELHNALVDNMPRGENSNGIASYNDHHAHSSVVKWWRRTGKAMGWL